MKAIEPNDLIVGQKYFDIMGEGGIELLFVGSDANGVYFEEVEPQEFYGKGTNGYIGFTNVGCWYQES